MKKVVKKVAKKSLKVEKKLYKMKEIKAPTLPTLKEILKMVTEIKEKKVKGVFFIMHPKGSGLFGQKVKPDILIEEFVDCMGLSFSKVATKKKKKNGKS